MHTYVFLFYNGTNQTYNPVNIRILVVMVASLFSIEAFCQHIHGVVQDEQGKHLSYMNVAVKNAQDTTLVSYAVSDENGSFQITTDWHQCILDIEGIGFRAKRIAINDSTSTDINLGFLTMEKRDNDLDEVVVLGNRKVTFKNGEYKMSVSGTSLEKQRDIFSVLSFLPFVITNNQSISILGKGKILIMLDGREITDMSEITNLKPSRIKEVSVMPHASSMYDSECDAVIKIKTVYDIKDYLTSQVTHNSIFARGYSNSQTANINYKRGKWNNFVSYTFKHLASKEAATNTYWIWDAENQNLLGKNMSANRANNKSNENNLILSSIYTFDAKNSLRLQYILGANNTMNDMKVSESSLFQNESQTSLDTEQRNHNTGIAHNIILNYVHTTNSSTFAVNGGFIHSSSDEDNNVMQGNQPYAKIGGQNKYNVYTLKVDYDKTFSEACRLQLGTKYSYIDNKGYSFSEYDTQSDNSYNDHTHLQDGVLAVYASLSGQVKKLYYEGGLRGEYASSRYDDHVTTPIKRDQFKVFPSMTLVYPVSSSLTLCGGYVMRGIRPTYSELSPLQRYVNAHLYEQGNPTLEHMISHNPYLTLIIKNKVSVEINFYHKANLAMYTFEQKSVDNNIMVNKPINVNVNYWDLRASYSDKFGLYRFAYNAGFHYDLTRIPYQNGRGISNKPSLTTSLVNQFDLTDHLMLFCNLDMSSSYTSLGSKVNGAYNVTLGAYATFFKDKRLTLIVSGNDLFKKSAPNNGSYHFNVQSARTFDTDNRNLSVTLRYNINRYNTTFNKNDSNSDEQLRIK